MDDGTHMPWHRSSSKRIYVASLSWVVHNRVYPACLYHTLRTLIVKIEHNQLQKQDLISYITKGRKKQPYQPALPMEWAGFNNHLVRLSEEIVKKQASTYYVPVGAADQFTACTSGYSTYISGLYIMKSLQELGMTYSQLSPDMQLYIQALQIKLSD